MGDNIYEDKINISLNSTDAILKPDNSNILYLSSYLSNVEFPFKSILTDDPDLIYSTVNLVSAQIAVSFYQVNYTNNTLNVKYYSATSSSSVVYTITRGNYNITNLLAEISTQSSGYLKGVFNKISGLITLTSTHPTFSVSFQVLPSTISKSIGFNASTTYSSSANVIIAPFPASLLTTQKLKVCSSALTTNSLDSSNTGKINLIQSIPVNAPPYSIINYENQLTGTILTSKRIDSIDIQILDENNRFVNFNNVNWNITISIIKFKKLILPNPSTFQDKTTDILQPEPLGNTEQPLNPIFTDTADLDFYLYQHGIDI